MLAPITAQVISIFLGLILGLYVPIAVLYLVISLNKIKNIFSAIWILFSRIIIIVLGGISVLSIAGNIIMKISESYNVDVSFRLGIYGGLLLGLTGLVIGFLKGKRQKVA